MGYTHNWKSSRAFTDAEWKVIKTNARKILRVAQEDWGIALSEEYDVNRTPVLDAHNIRFNGYADEGHETFLITKAPTEFSFCKTANKEYDSVVVAMLQLCAVHCDGFSWWSDGDRAEHADGIKLYNEATGANWDYSNVQERE